ncbi:MAG: 4-(cytidine 5'-diphospho)-2-C-methyl-D-erythritol kinase [Oscillospiraceae bacterium]|jgi:4-diphosphocytidyl-2-C-methyl-D-erythritol kinase|nr:4-(cytidine 5'-diphospho)-2-C-methyl-D-erythritol kinase [Oscillospiraceae bacterium]
MDIRVHANAKINLTLDVIDKRKDGYHLVEMLMQSVDLQDTVHITLNDEESGIFVQCNKSNLPLDQSNIAARAAKAFFEAAGIENYYGVQIKIKKRIPIAAGLAGGSADGAAVIWGLNKLLKTELDEAELCRIGEAVGADLPFCIRGGTMLASGTGTILDPLPSMPSCYFVIAKPDFSVATKEAYARIDEGLEESVRPNAEEASAAICGGKLKLLAGLLGNVFESVLPEEHRATVEHIKQIMLENGALGACMSGSGPAVFGIFEDEPEAKQCEDALENEFDEVFLCKPAETGLIEV